MIGYCPAVGGGWSAEFVAHRTQLHSAEHIDDDVAVLADPLASALRPVLLHPPVEGDVVLVIGAGTIGIMTVKSLRAIGWSGPLACLARYAFQAELARRAGADEVFRTADEAYRWAEQMPGAVAHKPTLAGRFVEGGPSLVFDVTVGVTVPAGCSPRMSAKTKVASKASPSPAPAAATFVPRLRRPTPTPTGSMSESVLPSLPLAVPSADAGMRAAALIGCPLVATVDSASAVAAPEVRRR
jgi:threonine dehydrogenase-like Zn-dependent dehydrogenase